MSKLSSRCPYAIDRAHIGARLCVLLMSLCVLIRCTYYALVGATLPALGIYLALPVAAAILLIITVLWWGKTHAEVSGLSVLLGVVFFMVKATTFESAVHTALCMTLYVGVLVLYTLVIFGGAPRALLYPLFSLPLLYHIFVEDMQIYILADPPVPFVEWLPEMSVLCIMGALLALSFALHKKETE